MILQLSVKEIQGKSSGASILIHFFNKKLTQNTVAQENLQWLFNKEMVHARSKETSHIYTITYVCLKSFVTKR